ncbi:hypothetical protein HDU97_005223 [Phlyctochytrium planicorne]|nr:hypothetical protein HDU97_005223 [Phlyctochytrium planicorne]
MSFMKNMALALVAVCMISNWSIVSVAAQQQNDPCAEIATKDVNGLNIFGADLAMACYNSFPISPQQRKSQIDALKTYFNLYVYLDMAKNSEFPLFHSKMDILAKLDKIASNNAITSEFQFHREVIKTVKGLHDAHTQYVPRCFRDFVFVQPFVLAPKYPSPGQKPIITVKTTILDHFKEELPDLATALQQFWSPVNLASFVGQEIVSIDGKDALTAVLEFADVNVGQSRSPETRFNAATPSYAWTRTPGVANPGFTITQTQFSLFQTPVSDLKKTLNIVLRDLRTGKETNIDAPYAVLTSSAAFGALQRGGGQAFYSDLCGPNAVSNSANANEILINEGIKLGRRMEALRRRSAALEVDEEDEEEDDEDEVDTVEDVDDDEDEEVIAPAKSFLSSAATKKGGLKDLSSLQVGTSSVNIDKILPGAAAPPPPTYKPLGPPVGAVIPAITLQQQVAAALTNSTPVSTSDIAARLKLHTSSLVNDASKSVNSRLSTPVASDPNGAFFRVDAETGVWVLSSFSPLDESPAGIQKWIETTTTGLILLENLGVKRLLIDVTNNGGGLVCAGQAFLQFLMRTNEIPIPKYDLRLSKPMEGLWSKATPSSTGAFSLAGFTSLSNFALKSVSELTNPGRGLKRGGKNGKYTNQFAMDCSNIVVPVTSASKTTQLKRGWSPENIAIISNGFCGSTCAQFVRSLRTFNVRAYTYGGSSGSAFQPTSFEGGAVMGFSDLLSSTDPAVQGAPVPFTFPTQGSIAFLEAYSVRSSDPDVPAEFIRQNADAHFLVDDHTDPLEVWAAASHMLQSGFGEPSEENQRPVQPEADTPQPVQQPTTQQPTQPQRPEVLVQTTEQPQVISQPQPQSQPPSVDTEPKVPFVGSLTATLAPTTSTVSSTSSSSTSSTTTQMDTSSAYSASTSKTANTNIVSGATRVGMGAMFAALWVSIMMMMI